MFPSPLPGMRARGRCFSFSDVHNASESGVSRLGECGIENLESSELEQICGIENLESSELEQICGIKNLESSELELIRGIENLASSELELIRGIENLASREFVEARTWELSALELICGIEDDLECSE
jgi:hypothetical protein